MKPTVFQFLLLSTLLSGGTLLAQAPKVAAVHPGVASDGHVDVTVALADQPFNNEWTNATHWTVLVDGQEVAQPSAPLVHNTGPDQLIIDIPLALTKDAKITLFYDKTVVSVKVDDRFSSSDATPLASIKGSYSPGLSTDAQYTLDASGQVSFFSTNSRLWSLGAVASIDADKRKGADPDSWLASGLVQLVPSSGGRVLKETDVYLFAPGGEFSREDTTRNLIAGLIVRQSVRFNEFTPKTQFFPRLWIGLGMEGGKNYKNLLTPTNGLGAIARGYGSADFNLDFYPKHHAASIPYFKSITLSSSYRVRIPALAESYTYTTGTTDNPYLSRKAAHHVTSELDYNFTDDFAATVTHEYGYLPPVFRLVDHKVTIGLKYSLKTPKHAFTGVTAR